MQDCGVRNERTSPTSRQHAQQPEPDGQTRLRSRGTFSLPKAYILPFYLRDLYSTSTDVKPYLRTASPNLDSPAHHHVEDMKLALLAEATVVATSAAVLEDMVLLHLAADVKFLSTMFVQF